MRLPTLLLFLSTLCLGHAQAPGGADANPVVPREFRAVWIATVNNIDWPSKPGLPVAQQKAEMLALLDKAAQLKLNAIIFQVRPACDAFYDSKLEPWSEYLTGQQGKAPEPAYDPLAFAVEEAHKRGLELHAWFNPYRARHPTAKSPLAPTHISHTQPNIVRKYGAHLWLDPGEKAVQEHSLNVVLDVVRRYDIDGVHLDDYFYPYKERDKSGKIIDFPDEPSWARYKQSNGTLAHDDWRRENVNAFIERLYKAIKAEKAWVKFGISPFGIWRPGYPAQVKGFDAYVELYADARKWLVNGWLDYFTPQLYWKIEQTAQSYPALLHWWIEQNAKGRHIWPGNFTSRVADGSKTAWSAAEILYQIRVTRGLAGATGNVHFSMKALMENRAHLADRLQKSLYAAPALVPASPWLNSQSPGAPTLEHDTDPDTGDVTLTWKPAGEEKVWLWVVQTCKASVWTTEILPGVQATRAFDLNAGPDRIAISAVDRYGNQSLPTVLDLKNLP